MVGGARGAGSVVFELSNGFAEEAAAGWWFERAMRDVSGEEEPSKQRGFGGARDQR